MGRNGQAMLCGRPGGCKCDAKKATEGKCACRMEMKKAEEKR